MDDRIEVSFCLPCFNVRPYLSDCIDSIIGQGLIKDSYEIICIDDCSSDGTFEELLALQNKADIKVLQNDANHGVSYTRNRMIKESKGKYIWFIDPDDLMCPDIARKFIDAADEVSADALFGNYCRIEETDRIDVYKGSCDENSYNACIMGRKIPVDQSGVTMNAIWAGVIRRDFLVNNALAFNENMITQEDTLLYYEMGEKSERIFKISAIGYLYRQRKSSVMNTHSEERNRKTYFTMKEMLRVYMQHKNSGEYKDVSVLDDKILHSKQNVAACLAALSDEKFIKEQLVVLKEEGMYPYKFRTQAFKGRDNSLIKVMRFLLPIEPFFWIYHQVYQRYNKRRNG